MAKSNRRLNVLLAKPFALDRPLTELLSSSQVTTYAIDAELGMDGLLCVKDSDQKRPKWGVLLDQVTGQQIPELVNSSSSAALLLRVDGDVFAFVFGYGRYLIEQSLFVQDFGLRTALNTLDENSLRSVDLHTLEEQPVQKKAQAPRHSSVGVFGIDILRDILRAVTGVPKPGVGLRQISGGDAMFAFSTDMDASDFPELARRIKGHYANSDYKASFSWVDNVRRIKDEGSIDALNEKLVQAVAAHAPEVVLTLPEIGAWDSIDGFSFTRNKNGVRPVIDAAEYTATLADPNLLTIEGLKRDRLFVHDVDGNITEHPVYRCVYYEIVDGQKTQIIFDGRWYEVDASFSARIAAILDKVEICKLVFPPVETWDEDGKAKIESEGDYNERTAAAHGYYLLDRKLVKTDRSTTAVELCDLLTPARQFVHVKHRKGGSGGLSHLFAQGGVAAEIMLGDKSFRKQARKVLRQVDTDAGDLVPLEDLRSGEYEVVFLILGEASSTLKENLPFFSKVNLSKTFEALTQRGFKVSVAGAGTIARVVN